MPMTGAGLGDAMADKLIARIPGLSDADKAKVREDITEMAQAIVDYLKANMSVTVTIGTGVSGLQRDPVSPNAPTLAPTAPVNLTGTVS